MKRDRSAVIILNWIKIRLVSDTLHEPRSTEIQRKPCNNRTLQKAAFSRNIMSNDGKKRTMRLVGIEDRHAIRCGKTRIFRLHFYSSPTPSLSLSLSLSVCLSVSFSFLFSSCFHSYGRRMRPEKEEGAKIAIRAPCTHSASSGLIGLVTRCGSGASGEMDHR